MHSSAAAVDTSSWLKVDEVPPSLRGEGRTSVSIHHDVDSFDPPCVGGKGPDGKLYVCRNPERCDPTECPSHIKNYKKDLRDEVANHLKSIRAEISLLHVKTKERLITLPLIKLS